MGVNGFQNFVPRVQIKINIATPISFSRLLQFCINYCSVEIHFQLLKIDLQIIVALSYVLE